MSTLIIDINNRCGIGRTKCRCKGSKRFVAASTGKVGSAKFTYCTHSTQSKGPNISKVLWNRIELQRTNGNPYAFQDVNSVTVFYYSERDIPGHLRKPLLIRVKRPYIDVRWYENVDSYANKRWKRIDESDEYPRGDNYTKDGLKLIKKLEELACKLFLSHGVRIESNDNYKIECPICSDGKTVQIRLEDYLNVPGYKKYTHDKNVISERSILIYNGRKLTFPKKSRVDTTYYLPITVDPDNGKGISVYYWNKDDGRTNPLLIEFETPSGYSRWIENISSNGKHERWRALSWKEEKPPGLKTRLDLLSCIYNKTVQINVGKFEGCHKNHHPLHKNRFNYSYKNVPETYPPIYVHTYESTNGPFVISGVTFNSQSQNFQVNPLLFNGVIRFMAYVSPCDKENPFLICVESTGAGSHSEYNWYERKDNNGNWKKHSFPGRSQLSPEEAGTEAEGFFETVQSTLKLNECYVSTPDNGIQLDVRLTLNDGQHLLQYTDTSTTNMTVPIFITKSREDLVPGFFKNSHKPATKDRRKFSVSKYLKSEGEIGGVRRAVSGVENVYVYFWEGNTIRPIIIKIQVSGEDTPRYYSKGNGSRDSWMYDMNRKKNIINLLDHWNCENNNAIPIELTMPTDTERFRSSVSPSKYLTNGLVTSSGSSYIPRGSNGIYKVEGYQINGDKKISRVTYNNKSTNIIPPYGYEGPTLNIYYWKDDGNNVPLLVEFKPKDVKKPSIWYENLGKDNTKWKPVSPTEAEKFYIDKDRKKELTDVFTKRLHEVNCTVNQIVQLDISQPPGRYCHSLSSLHNRRLKVSESRIKIPKYTLHEHTSAINGRDTFAISSIINKGVEQTGEFKFPLKDVKKVTVYFPNCNITMPILMRIEQEKNHGGYRWLKRTSATVWKEVSEYFEKVKDEPEKIRSLLDDIKNATLVCNNSPEVDPPSQGQSTLVDDDEVETWTTMFQGAVKEDKEESEEFFVQDEDEDEEIKEKMDKSTFTNDSSGPTAYSSNNLPGVGSPVTLSVSYSKPGVIIDIKGGNEELAETNYRIGTGGFVELDKKEDPKGFYRYTHTSCDEPPFKVEEVRHGANDIEDHKVDLGINHDESIEYLSVWYWKNDCIMKNPLFIEVLDGNGNYHYHFNKGDDIQWSPYKELDKLFTDEELERVLNRLNCQHNSVVQIDVTRVSGEYCHDSIDPQLPHKNSKIKVTKVDDRKLGNYTAYEHVPNPSGKFNISSLKRGDTPIIFSGLQLFPLKGAQKVVVYFCRSEVNTGNTAKIPSSFIYQILLTVRISGFRNRMVQSLMQ
ncbi:hypothetical protein BEWA_049150 [Theileria equi strain WA]|uniref:Uncharacterized protein n=1 Tax=Theileria equi strain WA TaxID=1537102 RepID=L1LBB0_THEEQ|nr:hypothetical protein BEWA_049150 [Theileria equi strain WA]EKX72448.1 hypothetical protein BEWA_049150 [Theileria equi strain WA]|eukprot:XP_004831900.1 hypothetical protein BEWA_049150 [Theileria equi strain WA]